MYYSFLLGFSWKTERAAKGYLILFWPRVSSCDVISSLPPCAGAASSPDGGRAQGSELGCRWEEKMMRIALKALGGRGRGDTPCDWGKGWIETIRKKKQTWEILFSHMHAASTHPHHITGSVFHCWMLGTTSRPSGEAALFFLKTVRND